ncbi:pyrroline-5-carboxylate reductase 3 [Exaiptasia diaphana]|uniref:Pyrroline-5-carboxylate reductase n=1 Tax=Exaiptasia diaphana TaxID=2652724 RepID=A0A913X7R9_EXADI|nr:pyrroline-5-carboxylate reductase 3 [Exaiptasia diaphana]KXJ14396.1 Pyrroline-5-carboxylate reductase 3 [Exaiptasia diaphana]
MADLRVGFVGGGNMALAIAEGIMKSGFVEPKNIIVSVVTDKSVERWQKLGCIGTKSNKEVLQSASIVFLAVKPHLIRGVLTELKNDFTSKHLVISVAAGLKIQVYEDHGVKRIVRVMPSLPCSVQKGASAFVCGSMATREDAAMVHKLMSTTGYVEEMKEPYVDIIASLSGSGSAFACLVIESLADGAVKAGLPRPIAMKFAALAVQGAGTVVDQSGKHPAQIKDETCSAGGSTICGIHELEKGGVRGAMMSAVEAACKRFEQLGNK